MISTAKRVSEFFIRKHKIEVLDHQSFHSVMVPACPDPFLQLVGMKFFTLRDTPPARMCPFLLFSWMVFYRSPSRLVARVSQLQKRRISNTKEY